MKPLYVQTIFALAIFAFTSGQCLLADEAKPNIIIFLADDLGYAAHPVCSPSGGKLKSDTDPDATPRLRPNAARIDEAFENADKNNDGKLSRDELPVSLSDRLDADKDGHVTEDELKTLRKPE
jgi:hypothetical protein